MPTARRSRRRTWVRRATIAAGVLSLLVFLVYPLGLGAWYLAKPRDAVHESALGLPHERVSFTASDGVRLSGWWVPGRNGAAVVVVHGGGGDREGAVAHARMLARAGYGVLLYDARGRGRSGGHENAAGWEWDRDVRGAVDDVIRRGARGVGLLGLSTGAEAVITEAASDPRVDAVVADGVQARTTADAATLPTVERALLEPLVAVMSAEFRVVRGQHAPPPLDASVARVAAHRPLLLIATIDVERTLGRGYARGTRAQLWELPRSGHTAGLRDQPVEYARRVLAVMRAAVH